MTETGTCTDEVFSCKAGYFCPADDSTTVNCDPCSEDIVYGQGCYCEDNKSIDNCQQCTGNKCSKCVSFTFLQNDQCLDCPFGCDNCASTDSCTTCSEGFEKNPQTSLCEFPCKIQDDCMFIQGSFCDLDTSKCQFCMENCLFCSSPTTCDLCDLFGFVTTLEGQCTEECENIQNGYYCENGVSKSCSESLTSECKCGEASNCASCDETGEKCKTCLPHMKFNQRGECGECDDGYELRTKMCWLSENQDPSVVNKLGGGAIAGIIIGVLIVVGGLCFATFWFMKKKVSTAPVQVRNDFE
ncbi:Cysteine-rich membrane protein 2 [Spironucleus salmonicida]|uniref:Cysteine-rich membrane protein 2 n=1 Tax=Spironucleus salmonicida TaxID=348837 RepID=V6M6P3_9EUKA|nr:Cysteine-rich membrane protein 2 [Spironucleus salmonicida]|eukprot:EST49089.1 Cysteine-rich membrane protein 2 [Spironucleus salmonicida]